MNGLTSTTLPDGNTIRYTYDDYGRKTKISTNLGNTSYEYDKLDRLTRVIAHNGTATVYEYDANGNRTAVRYSNGMIMTYEYDELNRLINQKTLDKDSNVVAQYTYTLGLAGERLSVTETDRTIEYEYDNLYRLVSETVTDENGTSKTTYTYDNVSNRLSKNENGNITTYVYNALNQLVRENDTIYIYDDAGNLIRKTTDGIINVEYTNIY